MKSNLRVKSYNLPAAHDYSHFVDFSSFSGHSNGYSINSQASFSKIIHHFRDLYFCSGYLPFFSWKAQSYCLLPSLGFWKSTRTESTARFPHAIELLNKKYADVFTILTSYPELENYLSAFMDAWQVKAGVGQIVESEMERIKNDPDLQHLIQQGEMIRGYSLDSLLI